jgi:hypothetical protein
MNDKAPQFDTSELDQAGLVPVEEKPKLTQEELDAKYIITPVSPERSPAERMMDARDISEFSSYMNKVDAYEDSMAGKITKMDSIRDLVGELNLDLGQAYGVMRDSGTYEGTPRRIVEEVRAKMASLPYDLQKVYGNLVGKYVSEGIEKFTK